MNKIFHPLRRTEGLTLIEIAIVVMILAIIAGIVIASYDTLLAKARFTKTRADMTGIANAGYADCSLTEGIWDFSQFPWEPPPHIMGTGQMRTWPVPSCPGWYYSWDNGETFGLNVVRVSLRRADESAVWSYCVSTLQGGTCDAQDIYTGTPVSEIGTANVKHLWCNE